MIPIRHESRRAAGFPIVTFSLIALCTALFFLASPVAAPFVPLDFMYGIFHPSAGLRSAAIGLVASLFAHATVAHLAANMWFLWLFGSMVEKTLGVRAYTLLYFSAGAVAATAQAVSAPLSAIPIVGASGAIAGVMGLALLLEPRSRLICYFPPIFFFPVPSSAFLLVWFGIQYINLYFADPARTSVAWWAHIGGFVFGVGAGAVVRLTRPYGGRRKKKASSK